MHDTGRAHKVQTEPFILKISYCFGSMLRCYLYQCSSHTVQPCCRWHIALFFIACPAQISGAHVHASIVKNLLCFCCHVLQGTRGCRSVSIEAVPVAALEPLFFLRVVCFQDLEDVDVHLRYCRMARRRCRRMSRFDRADWGRIKLIYQVGCRAGWCSCARNTSGAITF